MNKLLELLRDELNESNINKENCLDLLRCIENDLWKTESYIMELETKINKLEKIKIS
jgi:hypothetical protein